MSAHLIDELFKTYLILKKV